MNDLRTIRPRGRQERSPIGVLAGIPSQDAQALRLQKETGCSARPSKADACEGSELSCDLKRSIQFPLLLLELAEANRQ